MLNHKGLCEKPSGTSSQAALFLLSTNRFRGRRLELLNWTLGKRRSVKDT